MNGLTLYQVRMYLGEEASLGGVQRMDPGEARSMAADIKRRREQVVDHLMRTYEANHGTEAR